MTETSSENSLDQKGVQSVEVAARLLAALTHSGGDATLKQLAADAKLSASRAHAYLVSLKRVGLVEQNLASGRYLLGPQARQIGLAAIDQRDQYDVLLNAARSLRDETGRTVNLAIWTHRGPSVAHWARGREPLTLLVMNSGLSPPLLTTAIGRVFLAHLPADETQPLVDLELAAMTGTEAFPALRDQAAVEALKKRVLDQGFAFIKGILSPFVSAMAAPIRDRNGEVVAVLDILGRNLDPDTHQFTTALNSLKAQIRRTERELGVSGRKPRSPARRDDKMIEYD